MLTQSAAIKIVKNFVQDCKKNNIEVSSAWMFGSYAKGIAKEYSDIDVALVSPQFSLNFLNNNQYTALLNFKYPDIELHHFNEAIFNKSNDPFIKEIKQTGIEISQA